MESLLPTESSNDLEKVRLQDKSVFKERYYGTGSLEYLILLCDSDASHFERVI